MSVSLDMIKEIVTDEAYREALEKKIDGADPVEFLLSSGKLNGRQLLLLMSNRWKLPFVELDHYSPDPDAVKLINEENARRFGVLPLFILEDKLYAAMWDQGNLGTLDYLRQLTGMTVEPVIATRGDLEDGINRLYLTQEKVAEKMDNYAKKHTDESGEKAGDANILRIEDSEAPAIKLVNYIINQAINLNASDIHLEPYEKRSILRYRVDGVLHEFPPPPLHLFRSVVSRIKIISGMDVAEKRLPQDGRASTVNEGRKYDLRVSVIPNMHGEGVVIRILDTESKGQSLEELGFSEAMLKKFRKIVKRPFGIFLVTGPTGSGKSTTLYSTLKDIYSPKRKIITIEDPVEYQLEGITQIQTNPVIGFNFAMGLRSILRHDPDIIMVGEIRDLETAEIAIRSSLTGHLVFSTLHTNDSPTAVTRLIDMGIAPYLVVASLNGVLAQRLVRRLCLRCKKPIDYTEKDLSFLGLKELPAHRTCFEPVGCASCSNLGYRGREAVMEMLEISPEMKNMAQEKISPEIIKEIARADGYVTLQESLLEKFFSGITSLDEVIGFAAV